MKSKCWVGNRQVLRRKYFSLEWVLITLLLELWESLELRHSGERKDRTGSTEVSVAQISQSSVCSRWKIHQEIWTLVSKHCFSFSVFRKHSCIAHFSFTIRDLWADKNFMKFIKQKSKVLHLRRNNPGHQYVLDATQLESNSAGKDLGLLVDIKLSK